MEPEQTKMHILKKSTHSRTQDLPFPGALPINLPIPNYEEIHRKTNKEKIETTTYNIDREYDG